MDSWASCCFTVSARLGVLRAGRSVFRDNPFPSPCFLWHLNAGCGDPLCYPFGHFGLNFPWLLWQRETVVPPNSHSLSLSRAGTGTGEWPLNQGPPSCTWVPPCDPAHWCSILWSDITSLAAQKTFPWSLYFMARIQVIPRELKMANPPSPGSLNGWRQEAAPSWSLHLPGLLWEWEAEGDCVRLLNIQCVFEG